MDRLTRCAVAAARGDRVALETFLAETQTPVWRLCAHLVDPTAAADLAQEVYVRALSALPRYRGAAPALPWLLAIARHVCIDEVRRRTRRSRPGTAGLRPATTPDVADQVVLWVLVAALPGERRLALVLTQLLGLSYADAATVCGVAVGTIRSRVARARADLIDALRPAEPDESAG